MSSTPALRVAAIGTVSRRSISSALFILAFAGWASPPPADESWRLTLGRAASRGCPIVVITVPERCSADACKSLKELVTHPAIERRLASFETVLERNGERASVTVYEPSGAQAVRWSGAPDALTLRQMLTMVEGASEHLVASWRAEVDGDEDGAREHRAHAAFALGQEGTGRAHLEQLIAAGGPEGRQLATIFLMRLEAGNGPANIEVEPVDELAATGATSRVRYEARMLLGAVHAAQGRAEDAADAYRSALEVARARGLQAARDSLERMTQDRLEVLGLGAPGSVVAGRRTIQPRWRDDRTTRVEYWLDGQRVANSQAPPFATAINFGQPPRRQFLRVVGFDADGNRVHEGQVLVNDGTGRFAIRIDAPMTTAISDSSEVKVSVRVPHGRVLQWVMIEWNGSEVARMTSPPYRAVITASEHEPGFLRAAARLDDGSELEDVRLYNAGGQVLSSDVLLSEIPVNAGKHELRKEDLRVSEDGQPRSVDRVVGPEDAPLLVTLLLDVSSSMALDVLDVEEAAIRFVQDNLAPEDRVMIVGFDTAARVSLWPTSDRSRIIRAIQSLRIRGATALHDAVIMALLQVQPTGSRRAIVILSDGVDNASAFTMEDVAEVATRGAVPIYVVTMNPIFERPPSRGPIRTRSPEAKLQRKLATLGRRSGGDAFSLWSLAKLPSIWNAIAGDLAAQSLVVYRPEPTGANWRRIEVVSENHGRLRAPEGVYVNVPEPENPQQ